MSQFTEATVLRERCSKDSCPGRTLSCGINRGKVSASDGIKAMKTGSKVLVTIAATLLGAFAWSAGNRASAADVTLYPVNLQPPAPGWWYHYDAEAGFRAFLNNPQRDGIAALG